jgi:hypothetical protein
MNLLIYSPLCVLSADGFCIANLYAYQSARPLVFISMRFFRFCGKIHLNSPLLHALYICTLLGFGIIQAKIEQTKPYAYFHVHFSQAKNKIVKVSPIIQT